MIYHCVLFQRKWSVSIIFHHNFHQLLPLKRLSFSADVKPSNQTTNGPIWYLTPTFRDPINYQYIKSSPAPSHLIFCWSKIKSLLRMLLYVDFKALVPWKLLMINIFLAAWTALTTIHETSFVMLQICSADTVVPNSCSNKKEVYKEAQIKPFCLLFIIFKGSMPGSKANIHLFLQARSK